MPIGIGAQRDSPSGPSQFSVVGPPGLYDVLWSPDLMTWSNLTTITNIIYSAPFSDAEQANPTRRCYRTVYKSN
jgi:hypothetical protein